MHSYIACKKFSSINRAMDASRAIAQEVMKAYLKNGSLERKQFWLVNGAKIR